MTNKHFYPEIQSSASFPEIEKEILSYWQEHDIFKQTVDGRPSIKYNKNEDQIPQSDTANLEVLAPYTADTSKVARKTSGEFAQASIVGEHKRIPQSDTANLEVSKVYNEFVFYDGPPFANGLPHYGHLLTGFIKDVYARYQTTKGKKVERRFGWDCHGLPAEMGAEKELGFSGRSAITSFGIDKFNDHCRKSVMKYTSQWEQYVNRQARWVDFADSYKTMDINFMESVLWVFKELYKKGLIYQSMRVMPYSWACETPLSNFETRLDNSYRERADKAVTVSFVLNSKPEMAPSGFTDYRMLAWTTTPWTLPSNLALAVGADIDYVFVPKGERCYVIAKFAVAKYAKELGIEEGQEFKAVKGHNLVGLTYKPLFKYFADHAASFKVLDGHFVVEGDGTGIVHMAPGFGEDDQLVCQENGIELVCPVDNAGRFTAEVSDFEGMQVFEANDPIIIKLKEQGNWIKTEQFLHNYPHCWRTDTPLIYKAVPSWYVKVTAFKDRMVELNQQINWIPFNVRDNLFGKWLENARDWSISRNRFWGTPIPIWMSSDPKYPRIDVYGSIKELEDDFGVKITDLHRPFIDELTRPNPDDPTGKSVMRRVEDVFDCWFESGSMPYGQVHYPFENKEWFEGHFPADFIVEYAAQTRGWFYTLMVLSTALFDRPPFLNCICHGVILDSSGQKLSKRLNNYADPLELFEQYGADALRVTMLSSNVVKGQELLIDKEGKMVYDTLRLFIKPIWNAYHFFTMYANADEVGLQIKEIYSSENVLDNYILAKLKTTILTMERSLDNFDTQAAYKAIGAFFEVLNNWYIRRSRSRFWKEEKDDDKITAYQTLYTCLINMTKAMSSLLPLISEKIYLGLTGHNRLLQKIASEEQVLGALDAENRSVHMVREDLSLGATTQSPSEVEFRRKSNESAKKSVHLTDFPDLGAIKADQELMQNMDKVLDICNAALFVRNQENIRVRQPLANVTVALADLAGLEEFASIIKDELNVKSVVFDSNIEQYATYKLSVNFPVLGKRLPHKMKEVISAAKSNQWQVLEGNLQIAGEILGSEEFSLMLEPHKELKGAKALPDNSGLVVLDLVVTDALYEEGLARDLIRQIQQARKDANLHVSDRIMLEISGPEKIQNIVKANAAFINEQTLSVFDNQNDSGRKILYECIIELDDMEVNLKIG